MLPLLAPILLAPIAAPRVLARTGTIAFVTASMALLAAGDALILLAAPDAGPVALVPALLVAGLGAGATNGVMDNIAMSTMPEHRAGMAAGIFQTVRIAGSAFAVALGGALLAIFAQHTGPLAALETLTVVLIVGVAVATAAALPLLARDHTHRDRGAL